MPVCRCCCREGEDSGTNTSIRRSTEKVLDNNERVVTDISRIIRTHQDRNLKQLNLPEQAGDHVAASNEGENVPNTENNEKTPANVSKNVG